MTPAPPPGIYRGVPDPEYRAWDAISQSGLKLVGKSPAAYKASLTKERKQTEAMRFGSMVDCLCFEPAEWDARYRIESGKEWPNATCPVCGAAPKEQCTKKDGSPRANCCAGRRDLHVDAPGEPETISSDLAWRARQVADRVLSHPTAGRMIAGGETQVSLVWQDAETGCPCKGRLDIVTGGELVDLKTCGEGMGSPTAWPRHAWNLGYQIQLAYYLDGWYAITGELRPWTWIAAETGGTYEVGLYRASDRWIALGREEYRRHLALYAWCSAVDDWPGYREDVVEVDPPAWAGRGKEEVEG